jgi:hypothetical protein
MNKFRQLGMAVVLAFTLALPVFAGITDTPPAPPPPPAPDPPISTRITDTPPAEQSAKEAADPVVDFTLILLQSVLSAF